ncbi:MAG TPA: hypothetical protein DD648_05325 [Candidatus Omnitrophica bacterium]|nr:hypothetical protein [Candidatus Omnitrophota bacterium]
MKFNVNFNNNKTKPEFSEDARKAISLLYLEEALYKEQYEECAEIVSSAKRFGAESSDINKVIAKYLKGAGRTSTNRPKQIEASEPKVGRRRAELEGGS